MLSDEMREKFELYRKWFKTLLIEEFLNLPSKQQDKFLTLVQKFQSDCVKIADEGKTVKERTIEITVKRIIPEFLDEVLYNKDTYTIYGTGAGFKNEIEITYPVNKKRPKIGSKITPTIFSVDGETWYSSKKELLNKKSIS